MSRSRQCACVGICSDDDDKHGNVLDSSLYSKIKAAGIKSSTFNSLAAVLRFIIDVLSSANAVVASGVVMVNVSEHGDAERLARVST